MVYSHTALALYAHCLPLYFPTPTVSTFLSNISKYELYNYVQITGITCPSLPDQTHTSITYSTGTTLPFPYGTQAMYIINCPEGMDRDGGDDVRTCTGDGHSAVGVWNGTAPNCTGTYLSYTYL